MRCDEFYREYLNIQNPYEFQVKTWQLIQEPKFPLLIKAPGGSGKTEAVVAPFLAQFVKNEFSLAPRLMGASLSHAIPHMNPKEIVVVYSETGPLPFPVSPMYSDYISKTAGLMPKDAKFLYWGPETPEGFSKKDTIDGIFAELLSKV